MRKIGVAILSALLLSGCTSTNGVLTAQDVNSIDREDVKELVKKQKNIYKTSEDVKEMIKRINSIKPKDLKNDESEVYIEENKITNEDDVFVIDGSVTRDTESNYYFNKCVDILDETVANGIKKYIEDNSRKDISKEGPQSVIIGRASVYIYDDSIYMDPDQYENYRKYKKDIHNYISIRVNLKDVKDKAYSELINNVRSKDFLLQNFQIGKYQDFIKISNAAYTNDNINGSSDKSTRVSYEMFMNSNKKEIEKAKLIVIKGKRTEVKESDLYPFKNIASTMKFDTKDFKALEDITSYINKDASKTKSISTEKFNFRYRSSAYNRGNTTENNIIEIVVEKKK